jgi:hypothetical protein
MIAPNKRGKASSRRTANGNGQRKAGIMNFIKAPAYQQQDVVTMIVKGTPSQLSTTVTTGVIANRYDIDVVSGVTAWATRFQNCFDEYMVKQVRINVRPLATTSGVTNFWFDEKSNSLPTSTMTSERRVQILPNSQANALAVRSFTYSPRDLLDLQFEVISTPKVIGYFKTYTDNATYGAPIAVTQLWLLEIEYLVLFKGLKSA